MRHFRCRSLTIRIWTIFTTVILIIIFSISIIYLFAYKNINENGMAQDLKVSHGMLLKEKNFSEPNRFDEFRNLRGSSNFIFKPNESKSLQIDDINNKQDPPPNGMPNSKNMPPMQNETNAKIWMTSFVTKGTMNEKLFIKSYKSRKYIFIISLISNNPNDKSYLISYIPDMQDNNVLYAIISIGIVFIGIGLLASKLAANYISKPLKELEKYTVKIAHKDWEKPIEVKYEDEIGKLASSMNLMRNELKHADDEERMFLQSISHDLKTPVMVIMSHAAAIIDGVYIDTVEKNAEIIKEEAQRLDKKIKQILYLNTLYYSLQNGEQSIMVNLKKIILDIVDRFEMIKSDIEWDLDLADISMTGNEEKIRVSIENILDNALRYAESKIYISLKVEDNFNVLEIYNDGPNIPEEHINHVFDHFYKDKTGNFGLGLAISKETIDFYKGEIKVVNRKKGVCFIIRLPILKE